MDKLVLDETSDYGSRETSSEEGIGGLCQVKFKGMQPIFQELRTESVGAFGYPRLVIDIMEVVGNTKDQWTVLIEDRNFELDACETF